MEKITNIQLFNLLNLTPSNSKLTYWEQLINNTYTHQLVEEIIDGYYGGDVEEGILGLLQEIINNYNSIIFMDMETGEITAEINFNNYSGGALPPIIAYSEAHPGESNKDKIQGVELDEEMVEFNGFYDTTNGQTYKSGNVTIHKPPFGSVWSSFGIAGIKTAEIRDIYGKVLHEFYGSCNDFNSYFLSMASKSAAFLVYVFDVENNCFLRVNRVKVWLGTNDNVKSEIIEQRRDFIWKLAR